MYPSKEFLQSTMEMETNQQVMDANFKLQDIKQRISSLQKAQKMKKTNDDPTDWTKTYSKWSDWEKIDSLKDQKTKEEQRIQSLLSKQDFMSHQHDHSKEREFFLLSEEDKYEQCEEYRLLGDYLVLEGSYARAAENYKISTAYYEYCFPDSDEKQHELDTLRQICLCGYSLCCIYLGSYREAIDAATQVIQESKSKNSIAYMRRGVAFRHLDEYENALEDLNKALKLSPENNSILEEINLVNQLNEGYQANLRSFSKTIFNTHLFETNQNNEFNIFQSNSIPNPTSKKDVPDERKFSIFNDYIPIEPVMPDELQQCFYNLYINNK